MKVKTIVASAETIDTELTTFFIKVDYSRVKKMMQSYVGGTSLAVTIIYE